MRDKYLVAVCNLKPASMRGVKSFAMVLCATSKEGKEGGIELIQPPAGSKPGDRIFFEGAEFESTFLCFGFLICADDEDSRDSFASAEPQEEDL